MLDAHGYRFNVGIILINEANELFWAKRIKQDAWQFPQGGVDKGESAEQALYRELYEEIGLKATDVKLLAQTKHWLSYKLPKQFLREHKLPLCIGQKQKWFLLRLISPASRIQFTHEDKPEFDGWRWVKYWYPLAKIISFKKEVYRKALSEFSLIANGLYYKKNLLDPLDIY